MTATGGRHHDDACSRRPVAELPALRAGSIVSGALGTEPVSLGRPRTDRCHAEGLTAIAQLHRCTPGSASFIMDAMSPPHAALVFDVVVETDVTGAALCALAIDLERYAEVEPRLRSAHWIGDGVPRPGAFAAVVGDIPFSVPIVERAVGHPHGIATLEQFAPPWQLAYRLETPRAVGHLTARFSDHEGGCTVAVDGWIVPRRRFAHVALAPLALVLRQLANEAIARGVLRAAAAVAADHNTEPSAGT